MSTNVRAQGSEHIRVIPAPAKVEPGEGVFPLDSRTVILASKMHRAAGEYLAEVLAPATGLRLAVRSAGDAQKAMAGENRIVFVDLPEGKDLGEEGYSLSVDPSRVVVQAAGAAGAFYACQTLRQLLPPEIESRESVQGIAWTIPGVRIEDRPRFGWRGSLLDCCRHFRTKEYVKRFIDLLVYHKMNVLHWHLTEDQGWRIEIKRYPRLTEVGAWRNQDGERYGGFYARKDVKEIVKYAADRHVMVVPEIEMPGHSMAALACYPELSCVGGPFEVPNHWGVFKDVYCAGNDETFTFLENVLTEVVKLFPAPYLHIGGDEVPKDRWKECPKCQGRIQAEGLKDEDELQSYFIKRIEKFLLTKRRNLVGWDEILQGGLSPHATVQSWRGMQGGIAAAKDQHDVVMSPTSHCYLDYDYERISVAQSYSFEPVPEELSAEEAKHILGLEGNLWAERMPTEERVDYQAFPRLCALAEAAWSPKDRRNYGDFRERLKHHGGRLDRIGVKYYRDPDVWGVE